VAGKRLARGAISLAVLAPLAACVVSDDPRQGGIIGGIGGLSSGAYDKRIQDRQNASTALKAENEALENRLKEVQARQDAAAKERAAAESQLATLKQDISSLRTKLTGAEKEKLAGTAAIGKLKRELASLEAEAGIGGSGSPQPQRPQEIDAKRKQLEAALDEAIMISSGAKR
jgi:chromosome segregation ATPase